MFEKCQRRIVCLIIEIRMRPPNDENLACSAVVVIATTADVDATTVECPNEKNRPTATGRFASCISSCVMLSIAAIRLASTAWRRPNV